MEQKKTKNKKKTKIVGLHATGHRNSSDLGGARSSPPRRSLPRHARLVTVVAVVPVRCDSEETTTTAAASTTSAALTTTMSAALTTPACRLDNARNDSVVVDGAERRRARQGRRPGGGLAAAFLFGISSGHRLIRSPPRPAAAIVGPIEGKGRS
uniref:Uncharacterized protein n=1 Tax=Oryza sativa subsp. japonica TaxID=39947 RepID=Q69SN3_ORYSJ|nr:hypothetical protein [Oryza sativa Japonica Group]